MSLCVPPPPPRRVLNQLQNKRARIAPRRAGCRRSGRGQLAGPAGALLLCGVLLAPLAGCGSGGYAGGGIQPFAIPSVSLDAGQSYQVTPKVVGSPAIAYTLSGPSCSGSGCGTLSTPTGPSTVYTAPSAVTTPTQVTISASVPGTSTASTLGVTVDPVPSLASTLPGGTVGVAYTGSLNPTGGTTPYTLTTASGSLPPGLSLNAATGAITGTPTAPGAFNFTAKLMDSSASAQPVTAPESIVVAAAALVLAGNPPAGNVGAPYSATFTGSGGIAPYSFTVLSGTPPAGLTLSSGGVLSGTPTTQGTSAFTLQLQDSSGAKTSSPYTIAIGPAALSLATSSLPNGTVGTAYSSTIGVSGGTAPYSCTITGGTLQAGLTLTGCLVSGTPTAAGTANLSVKATDASNPQETTTGPVSLTIAPAPLVLASTMPNGTEGTPYNSTIGVSGGTTPYSCTITSGTLQAGLTLTGCLVSGTPTAAGTANLTVKATDASNPQQTTTGPVSLTIAPAPLVLASTMPNGTEGTPYNSTIGVSGGTTPYSCTITSGTLQAGLTLTGCLVSGTPTAAGTANLTVKATDASNPQETTTGPVSLTIAPAPLSLTTSSLPNGTVGTPYSSMIGVGGGTAPYSCTVVNGTLPAGLSLNGCAVSGTPTVAGTANLTVKATDSSTPQETTNGPESITINPAGSALTVAAPAAGTVNTPYSGIIGVSGGTAPYSCTLTGGTLPAGLSISNCTISGTPTAAGTTPLTVKATDSSSPAATTTTPVNLVINPASSGLTLASPPAATVATAYTGTIGVSGGTAPYTCSVTSGTLPAGLAISNCTISGTPTTAGSTTLTVAASDSSNPAANTSGPLTVTVQPVSPLTLAGSVPSATLGVPYTQTLTAQGGVGPYTYAVTAGALPAGLNLSTGGVISGTPTAAGASSFTVTATDSESTPQTASLPLMLQVLYPTTANDGDLDGPYAYLFQGYDDVTAGVFAFQTATVGSFTADGLGGISAGELVANHQNSAPAGNTVPSSNFVGTYTIGTDNRGSLTLTLLNPDGTTGATTTYAIAVKAPVSPATTSTEGSLIESDDNQVVGTKGSGMFLAQTPAAFAAGLNGSYAFGISGDTPCLPSCTAGIVAGPAATVGRLTTDGAGAITGGNSDTNIATTNIANSDLSGTYGAADGNGLLPLSLTTAGTAGDSYPADFAVYIVNATQAFILSTDKHSSYILLAGSAQMQTQGAFSDASMNGPFIGYENSASDPALLSTTVQNTLNYSTATVFRGTGTADGNCDITNVDTGGTTALVNYLSGQGGSATGLTGALGAYTQTGATTCAVTANGRGVLQYPVATVLGLPTGTPPAPRVFYLISPNAGYFLETSYAGLGRFEAQTGAPFSQANTFTGTYVYQTVPASSLASTDTSGVIASNGNGTANSTLDENVGVGTVNVIQLGQTATQPYTAPDPTTGRFTFGTSGNFVIYAINPNRFALVDTSATTISPSVGLLY